MSVPLSLAETLRTDLSERDLVETLKSYLAGTLAALKEEQRLGPGGGLAACRKYSDAMDNEMQALHDRARGKFLFSAPDLEYRLAVLSVGGYGRAETCSEAEIEPLFLHPCKSG